MSELASPSNNKPVYRTKEIILWCTLWNLAPLIHNVCFRLWSFNQLWAPLCSVTPSTHLSSLHIHRAPWNSVKPCQMPSWNSEMLDTESQEHSTCVDLKLQWHLILTSSFSIAFPCIVIESSILSQFSVDWIYVFKSSLVNIEYLIFFY